MVRTLGIDTGEKRIGLALTDPLGITAQGLEVITFDSLDDAIEQIEKLCLANEVGKVVIGNPLNMNGTEGPASEKARNFAETIQERLQLEVIMIDERLSSKSAENVLISGGIRRKKRREIINKLSAVIILETYIATQRKSCQ